MVIDNKLLKEMKKLRAKGLSYSKISIKLGVDLQKVVYHLNEHYREWRKKVSRENRKYDNKSRKYFREYRKNRYKNDPEFREKVKREGREYYKKRMGAKDGRSKNKRK